MLTEIIKCHGSGNEFVMIDLTAENAVAPRDLGAFARELCGREESGRCDGALYVALVDGLYAMRMFNPDGSEAEMCGNGIRCVGKFVYDKGLTDKRKLTVVSAGQVKYLELETDAENKVSRIKVNMGKPVLEPERIPVAVSGGKAVNVPICVEGLEYRMTCVSMGNPHAVIFVDGTEELELERIGPQFEHHELFPRRTNTEFVQVIDRRHVKMRVWERGTGETLACGTGCCATAVACVLNGLTDDQVTVSVLGGEIEVMWDREHDLVYMSGPAVTVFEGEVNKYV